MKQFCEQIIEFHENKNGVTTKTSKDKKSVISVEKRGKDKESEKVPRLEHQQQSNKSPNLGEKSDWIKAEKQEVRQIPGIMGIKKAFSKDTKSLFQNSSLPTSCVSSDPRQRKQSSQTQIQTKTINGVKTETRTETIVKDGITTVNVYVNGKLAQKTVNGVKKL